VHAIELSVSTLTSERGKRERRTAVKESRYSVAEFEACYALSCAKARSEL
jgi:hypothetical protein